MPWSAMRARMPYRRKRCRPRDTNIVLGGIWAIKLLDRSLLRAHAKSHPCHLGLFWIVRIWNNRVGYLIVSSKAGITCIIISHSARSSKRISGISEICMSTETCSFGIKPMFVLAVTPKPWSFQSALSSSHKGSSNHRQLVVVHLT